MKIALVTPAAAGSTKGNRVSANRYAKLFRELGHQVSVTTEYNSTAADALVALHAKRSERSVQRFRRMHADKPIVVVLTGTDLYRDLPASKSALRSLQIADKLVVLQPLGIQSLPARFRNKSVSIIQSAEPPPTDWLMYRDATAERRRKGGRFLVLQLSHLRPVKDPFLVARAARFLPDDSLIDIHHLGAALQAASEKQALRHMQSNAMYSWIGERSRPAALHRLAKSDLLVLSSKLEGGANVICEALAHDVPVICSRIPGSIGLLGADYPGYFPVGNARALATLLERASTDRAYLRSLQSACRKRKRLVTPSRERNHWKRLLGSCTSHL